jgi:hypothetical protein
MSLVLTTTPAMLPAAAVAVVLSVAGFRWFTSRARRGLLHRVVHLAQEIRSVGASIHADLTESDEEFLRLAADCSFLGRRAAHFLEQRSGLRRMSAERLQTALERLHDDHRRIVDLRWEVDAKIARRRRVAAAALALQVPAAMQQA